MFSLLYYFRLTTVNELKLLSTHINILFEIHTVENLNEYDIVELNKIFGFLFRIVCYLKSNFSSVTKANFFSTIQRSHNTIRNWKQRINDENEHLFVFLLIVYLLKFPLSINEIPYFVYSFDRWDNYLAMTDGQMHWFSIVNSVIVVFFLAGVLSMIIVKTLRRDIARYNQEDSVRLKINLRK